ncbi:hypothetical protein ACFYM0_14275 [Streptomyces sp. NPDC006487]
MIRAGLAAPLQAAPGTEAAGEGEDAVARAAATERILAASVEGPGDPEV